MSERSSFQTVNGQGLDRESFPMKLWEKAKKLGVWNPNEFDFSQDRKDWMALGEMEKDFVLRTIAQFQAGEEAVTLDLLPLISFIAREGRLEEEIYLTSFLWEEAKHVDGFNRFITSVLGEDFGDLSPLMVDSYKLIFYQLLPEAMNRLYNSDSAVDLARASVTYNMIIEGVLAETGYYVFHKILQENNIMPGLMSFVGKLKQDESRHIAYGIYLISRLVAENGDEVWAAVQDQMNLMLLPSIQLIEEAYELYDVIPFGMNIEEFTNYAMNQFQKRMARLEKARSQTLEEINAEALA